MTAPTVLDLLFREPIRARLGLTELDVETARGWIDESGIRWGADAPHREEVGQPTLEQNTWRFGLDRLLLGYAAGDDGDLTYADVLPSRDVDGSSGATLGALATLAEGLSSPQKELQGRVPRVRPRHPRSLRGAPGDERRRLSARAAEPRVRSAGEITAPRRSVGA